MSDTPDVAAIARSVLDANQYLVLGTVDADGLPWVTPVYFASADHTVFYWISDPEAAHSRNLAARPRVSIVVFDSQAPVFTGQAVYMSAVAEELAGAEVDRGLEIYPGRADAVTMTAERLRPPFPYRLYRATASEHWILCPRDSEPCVLHGRSVDHRAEVTIRRL